MRGLAGVLVDLGEEVPGVPETVSTSASCLDLDVDALEVPLDGVGLPPFFQEAFPFGVCLDHVVAHVEFVVVALSQYVGLDGIKRIDRLTFFGLSESRSTVRKQIGNHEAYRSFRRWFVFRFRVYGIEVCFAWSGTT